MSGAGRNGQARLVEAGARLISGDSRGAVQLIEDALDRESAGSFGWLLPIDPVFAELRESGQLQRAFELLSKRAE